MFDDETLYDDVTLCTCMSRRLTHSRCDAMYDDVTLRCQPHSDRGSVMWHLRELAGRR
jgi:hypothetical protein